MSMDYVEIDLDRPRKLRYGFRDLRDLERRLGGAPFEKVLDNLRGLHLETLVQVLCVGLRWDDPKIGPARTEELVGTYLRGGGEIAKLLEAISEALTASGIIGKPKEEEDRPTGAA